MNMNTTNITPKKARYLSLAIACVVSAIAMTSVWLTTTTKAQSVTVSAADIQRWSLPNSAAIITFFGDGDILAAACQSCPSRILNHQTGATINPGFPNVPDVAFAQPSIRLSTSEQDSVFGGWQNQWKFSKDGTQQWVIGVGCCNSASTPWALDGPNNIAYMVGGVFNGMAKVDMSTGLYIPAGPYTFPTFAWSAEPVYVSMADSDNFYLSARTGWVAHLSPFHTTQWQLTIDPSLGMQPGAVAADGSFVVTSGAPHFNAESLPSQPGRLARILSDGTVVFNNFINATTPPVIGGNGMIFVGTQVAPINANASAAIEAYDLNGNPVWSTTVQGLPNDLLVGNDGAVYAGTGAFNNGAVYILDQNTGAIRKTITNVAGAFEMMLQGGVLYTTGSALTALPVDAVNYDPMSPWPRRSHDNQRTNNRQSPILTPPRDPGPDSIAPSSSASNSPGANAAGWNNTNTDVLLAAEDNSGGSGVESIAYSATGAQAIATTTVNAATTALTINTEGVTTITYHSSDVAGNHESPKTIVIKIDKTAPTISVTSPTAGSYLLNQIATIDFSCTDSLSGVASCTGSSPNGSALDTASIGAKSVTVTATDLAGNTSLPTVVNYTVGYGIVALYDQTKTHKSGSTIPIKIRLVDANGANVSSVSTVVHAVSVIQISSQASTNFEDSGNSNPDFDFRYDASLGGYIFNLKTTGFGTGSYLMNFLAGNGSTVYSVGFQVRQ
jgi:hypothetical protein